MTDAKPSDAGSRIPALLRAEMERYWQGFSSRHQLTDAIEAAFASPTPSPSTEPTDPQLCKPSDAFAELMKDLDHICAHGDRGSQETAHDARDRLRAILTTPAAVATAATPSAASVPTNEPVVPIKCALCWSTARIPPVCDACHDSMGTKPKPAAPTEAAPSVLDQVPMPADIAAVLTEEVRWNLYSRSEAPKQGEGAGSTF